MAGKSFANLGHSGSFRLGVAILLVHSTLLVLVFFPHLAGEGC